MGETKWEEEQPPYEQVFLESCKRKELQSLCKKHDIKCTGKVARKRTWII